jgi:hypothetical protein
VTADQAVALQIAQGLGQHTLRDVGNRTAQLAEAHRTLCQRDDDERAPLVADPVKDTAYRATGKVGACGLPTAKALSDLAGGVTSRAQLRHGLVPST